MKSRLALIKSVLVAGWLIGAILLVTPLSISKAAVLGDDGTKGGTASNRQTMLAANHAWPATRSNSKASRRPRIPVLPRPVGRASARDASPVTDRERRTSRAAETRPRSGPSKRRPPSRSPRTASLATPVVKSTTTSAAASTGAMTSGALIVMPLTFLRARRSSQGPAVPHRFSRSGPLRHTQATLPRGTC